MSSILEWLICLLIAFAIAMFILNIIIINSRVPSGSMKNTIMPKSRMIGLRFSYWFNKPKRGQIIIFRNPDDTSKLFVKRIIGEPGDIVEIKQGETFVNNELLDEPYLDKSPRRLNYGPYEVPDKCYFVLGDNRNRSNDSRRWTNKYVPEKYILAKAVLCYWPTKYAGRIK